MTRGVTGLKKLAVRSICLPLLIAPIALAVLPVSVTAQNSGQQKIEPSLLTEMLSNPFTNIPVIIEINAATPPFSSGSNSTLAQQAVSILNLNGHAFGGLALIQGAAGVANAAGITAMSLLPQVATIEHDSVVRARRPSGANGPAYPPGQLTSLYPQEINAPKVWQQGGNGTGVTVAVLDSGVANDADLGNGSRVLAHVGFSGPVNPQQPDPGGHGSHIAGTIAGDGTKSAGEFVGVAPKANIVDVQVLDQRGNGRVSSVIRAMEWVLAHQAQFNIRAMNLSFGAPPVVSYKFDPFAAASEIAWRRGMVVVAAAGNTGPQSGTIESPGIDPYIITVGSTDDQATLTLTDDVLGWWSSWGTPQDSLPKPDLLAPGRRVVSIRVQGSTIDTLLPDHLVTAKNGSTYTRLTGTSMSTAVVSGAVALLLQRQPALKPDDVKNILASTTQAFGSGPRPTGAGAGLLDVNAAANSPIRGSNNKGLRQADGLARSLYPIIYGQPLVWNNATYLGTNWLAYSWLNLPWNDPAWDNIAWDNIAWDNIAWDNIAWDNIAWDNIAWDNIAWDNSEWDNIAWDSFKYD